MMTVYYFSLLLLAIPNLLLFIFLAGTRRYRRYLFVAIPVVLALVFKLIYTVDDIKSLPKSSLPPEYIFLHSVEIPEKVIYIWLVEKGKDTPHTVAIPWTANDSKAAQAAKKATAEGRAIEGRSSNVGRRGETLSSDEQGELRLYHFNLQQLYKK
jgi:hypothetical protein